MQKRQKGQSIVEFALVLPLFMIFVFGIVYFGMVMTDYLMLSSIARSSAREAAVASAEDYKDNYANIRKRYEDTKLPIAIFDWQPTNRKNFDIAYETEKENDGTHVQNVKVTMKAELNKTTGSHLGSIVNKLVGGTKLAAIDITYIMYSEVKQEK